MDLLNGIVTPATPTLPTHPPSHGSIDAYDVWLIVMNAANMLMHALGFSLLWSLKRKESDVQRVYLINISITEFLKNLFVLLTVIPDVIQFPRSAAEDIEVCCI